MRLGEVHYAEVLTPKENVCHRYDTRYCNNKELLVYMTKTSAKTIETSNMLKEND